MRHAMFLVPVALALTVSVASAESVIGFGMFAGVSSPTGSQIDNSKDSKAGLNMGFRIPMALGKISFEPFLDRSEQKHDEIYRGALDGMDITSLGLNLGIGDIVRNHGGLHFTPFVGGMMAKARREGGPGDDQFAWQAGLSIGLHGSEGTHWDLRGSYVSMGKLLDEPDHRSAINVSLGLTAVVAPR